jgi:hypothetical protein
MSRTMAGTERSTKGIGQVSVCVCVGGGGEEGVLCGRKGSGGRVGADCVSNVWGGQGEWQLYQQVPQ